MRNPFRGRIGHCPRGMHLVTMTAGGALPLLSKVPDSAVIITECVCGANVQLLMSPMELASAVAISERLIADLGGEYLTALEEARRNLVKGETDLENALAKAKQISTPPEKRGASPDGAEEK